LSFTIVPSENTDLCFDLNFVAPRLYFSFGCLATVKSFTLTFDVSDLVVLCTAIACFDADLDFPVGDLRDVETEIVSQSREPMPDELKQQITEKLNEALRPFGQHVKLAVLETRSSIAVYFICSLPEALHQLRCLWRRGQLKSTVEFIFTLLSGKMQPIIIKTLAWSIDNYQSCIKYFCDLEGIIHLFVHMA